VKYYDISLPLSEDLPTWPGDPKLTLTLAASLSRGDDANVTRLDMSAHSGTHIDAPFHFEPKGIGVDALPLEILIGPCRLFDLGSPLNGIDAAHLKSLDLKGTKRVLLKTPNSERWAQGDTAFHRDFVYLTTEGAEYLISQGVQLVGIDALSIEKYAYPGHPTHRALLRNKVVILEGLDLSAVPVGDYELIALPLKLKGADGAPARAILRAIGYSKKCSEHQTETNH